MHGAYTLCGVLNELTRYYMQKASSVVGLTIAASCIVCLYLSPPCWCAKYYRILSNMNIDPTLVKKLGGLGAAALAAAVGGIGVFNYSLYNVEPGHRAIIYNRFYGVLDRVYAEGTHFCVPFVERPIIYDVRTRPRVLVSLSGSREYDEKVLPSIINEVLKSVVAHYNASQLITQREVVSRAVRDQLVERAKDFNILLDDVSLTHLSFGPEYEKAVEAKQVAQQQAERGKYIVLRALEEKKSTIIKAQGEAEAAKLACTRRVVLFNKCTGIFRFGSG
ncbi:UNVERIFIED_CONTAM: hypothetical protein H355_006814 [Colinus virginianus]|nr:hypothetical protein H355_006814 [Colinus virginianus]